MNTLRNYGFLIMTPVLAVTKCDGVEKSQPNLVELHQFAGHHNLKAMAISEEQFMLSNESTRILFMSGARRFTFNDLVLFMNGPLLQDKRKWLISAADANNILAPMLRRKPAYDFGTGPVVILDPGHGGEDTGAKGRHKTVEKRSSLDIAKSVLRQLRSTGMQVRLTRERDRAVELDARSEYAKTHGGDIFVSIHLNSSPNHLAQGIETYALPARGFSSTSGGTVIDVKCPGNAFDPHNSLLAYFIHKEMLQSTQATDRGIRRARWKVLRDAPCPAVLVECGFLSNASEETKLGKKHYRDRIAGGIANGILTYVGHMSEKSPDP